MATLQRTMSQVMDREEGEDMSAGENCPMPTQDITLNLKNRAKAITTAAYGPENPKLPNEAFWRKKSDQWDVSIEDSKQSLCGNCAAFSVSDDIKKCIAEGIGMEADPWGTIKLADLGYCEIFDFKCCQVCHAHRSRRHHEQLSDELGQKEPTCDAACTLRKKKYKEKRRRS